MAFKNLHRVNGISLDDQVGFLYTLSDPRAGVGVEAPVGSILVWKFNPPEFFQKTGTGNNDWESMKYIHPSSHPASMITEDSTHRFVTDVEKITWNNMIPLSQKGAANGVMTLNSDARPEIDYIIFDAFNSTPSVPLDNTLKLYSRNRAGRILLEQRGPSGLETSIQPALFGNNTVMWLPGVGTTLAINWGVSWTLSSGTQAHPTITTASMLSSIKRATFTTANASGNTSGVRAAAPTHWRGNAAGLGGFFFFARFGFVAISSTMQFWVGLSERTTAIGGNPSTYNNTVCIGKDSTDANLQLIFRNATTTSKINLGIAAASGDIYDVTFFCPPNGSSIICRVVRRNDGTVYADNIEQTLNIPISTALLTAHAEIRNSATGAQTFALNQIYIESDI